MKLLALCLIVLSYWPSGSVGYSLKEIPADKVLEWWEGGNFYQIYPRSWKDSNGDGIGDLNGIKEKVDYLKKIGMDGVWLSPIFKSPMADFGYDISDYRDVYDKFGTLTDFDALATKCQDIGIRLILDLVPNHTSDEHEWFIKSERREPGYENYYIWHPGTFDPVTGKRIPPNNWLSVFTKSAWKWSPIRKQFYYHAFLDKQPDINYRDRKVVEEIKNVTTFWVDRKVAGFRIDAVPFLFEVNKDFHGRYPDEPKSGNPECTPDLYCYLNHPYTNDQDETYDMVFQWRKHLNDYQKKHNTETKIMMIEAYTSLENKIRFYGDKEHEGANVPFNFEMISNVKSNSSGETYFNLIDAWLSRVPEGKQANWVLGNHDNNRLATRLGPTRADMINIMLQTLPGVAITYQGEEMCLEDVDISYEQTVDPQGCNVGPTLYKQYSRDPARTPFPWSKDAYAGFTTGEKEEPWLPLGDDYEEHNVETELTKTNSHLKIFIKLTKMRKLDELRRGSYESKLIGNENVIAYVRTHSSTKKFIVVVLNFGKEKETVDLKTTFPKIPDQLKVHTASLDSVFEEGSTVSTASVEIPKDVGVVLISTDLVVPTE